MNENRIGQNIAVLRKNARLTQSELAEALAISPQAISKWERGASLPDTQTMPAIAKFFHVSIDFLYYGKAEKTMHDNTTVNRTKDFFDNRMIYRFFKEEDIEKLTDDEFERLQKRMKNSLKSRTGFYAPFVEYYHGVNQEDISGNGDHADFCIYKRILPAMENNRTMFQYWYERIFTLAYRLGVRNFYDIGCSEHMQGALTVLSDELTYTGIDPNIFHDYTDDFHVQPNRVNEIFEEFTRSDRIRYRQDKYPCALETAVNNIGIALQLIVSPHKPNPNFWNAQSREEIYAALSRDFERVVFSISTREPNPELSSTDIRDVISGKAEVWVNPFDELYEEAKKLMPDFEFCRISSVSNREIVFATKNPLDRSILEKHYTVIGDRLLTGVLDNHWHMEMLV
ncbi:MAG: helix-turn-helix domain-containing protein [Clostridia bacterium]|nr:helix-turn-helix domain-containing protein [Clostridia bacterium]